MSWKINPITSPVNLKLAKSKLILLKILNPLENGLISSILCSLKHVNQLLTQLNKTSDLSDLNLIKYMKMKNFLFKKCHKQDRESITKDFGWMEIDRVMVFVCYLTEADMKETGKTIWLVAMVEWFMLTETSMRASGKRDKPMVMDFSIMQMALNM